MNKEAQMNLAQRIWDDTKGNPLVSVYYNQAKFTEEENLAFQDLIKKMVIKRSRNSIFVSSQTKFFLENNGKTEREIKEEEDKKMKEKELELAKEANSISKKSMMISGVALFISFISICISIFKSGK
ncbi:MAG: hypothetical protein ACRC3I_00560 [Cetobacterium sp.]